MPWYCLHTLLETTLPLITKVTINSQDISYSILGIVDHKLYKVSLYPAGPALVCGDKAKSSVLVLPALGFHAEVDLMRVTFPEYSEILSFYNLKYYHFM